MVVGDFTYSPVYLRRYGDLPEVAGGWHPVIGLSPYLRRPLHVVLRLDINERFISVPTETSVVCFKPFWALPVYLRTYGDLSTTCQG